MLKILIKFNHAGGSHIKRLEILWCIPMVLCETGVAEAPVPCIQFTSYIL